MKNSQPDRPFSVEKEYTRCVAALNLTGLLLQLPNADKPGVIGLDGKEYPLPTLEEIKELFTKNQELVSIKIPQGFDRLELIPLAMPVPFLIDRLHDAILSHAAQGKIYQTRYFPSDPLIVVRVNAEKQVWIWETLRQVLDTDELVYFPQEYSVEHRGLTKLETIHNGCICAVPGWSVGLVENLPILPRPGQGKVLGERNYLIVQVFHQIV